MSFVPTIRWLLAPALLLPMVLAVLFGLMGVLTAIDDAAGAAIVRGIGWVCLVLWIVDIAALAMAVAAELVLRNAKEEGESTTRP